MSTALRSHARTDVGRVRDHNEDNFLVDRKLGLFVVADGMGGHASGEVASASAVRALREALKKDADFIEDFRNDDRSVRPEDIKNLLEAATHSANQAVFQEAQKDPDKRGMGTTLTSLLLINGHGFIAHVGDSRVYLLRGGEVRMLTEDHSVLNELKRRGKLKPELVEKMQIKNAVTRAVGVFETVEVDTFHFLTAPGDRYMLCSDGLHGYLNDDAELASVIAGVSEETATQRLIDLANERGGKDNITAIVVDIPEQAGEEAGDVALSYDALRNMPFFRNLESRELLRVQALARPRAFGNDEVVVREGDAGESIFIVLKGRARVLKNEAEIASLGAGEFFGEMALIDKTPRSASVRSDGNSRMLEVSRADFFKILREEKEIGIKLLWNFVNVLAQRLKKTSAELGHAKEALAAEDLTDELFLEDEAMPSQAMGTAPTIPAPRPMRRDTLIGVDPATLAAVQAAANAQPSQAPQPPSARPAPLPILAPKQTPEDPVLGTDEDDRPTIPPPPADGGES